MLKVSAFALTAALLFASPGVSAQSIEIGPRGPSVDFRGPGERERDIRRDERTREREREMERREMRRAERRGERRGGAGCREITIRERDAYGRMVTRTREECRR